MKRIIIYIGMLISTLACTQNRQVVRSGDLLFMAGESSPMSGAIVSATGDQGAINFSHVGIALMQNGADSVLEATTEGGVQVIPLTDFLNRAARIGGKPAVVAMRLQDTTGVGQAIERARGFLGQPYDYSYRPDNGKQYCSELVWESYRTADGGHRFAARAMNFRAVDGSMPAFWEKLFGKLGEAVPEGVPGTNPNDLSKDAQLREIYRWY